MRLKFFLQRSVIAGGADHGKVVEAERIVLRDKGGKMRALLEVEDDGSPRLVMIDDKEKAGVKLTVDTQLGSSLNLHCEKGGSTINTAANGFGV